MYKTIKDLSKKDQNHLPTNQDIDSYNNKGWYISPIMIEASVIDDALQGVDEFYKGEKDFNFLHSSRIADEEYSDAMAIRNNEFVAHQNKKLRALAFHPLISATASLLAQTKEIRYFADSLINKVPEKPTSKGVVGWHSDKAYWPTCSSNKMLTAWIPLQDCTIEMGPLMHLDKSHLWKDDLELKTYFSFNNQNLEKFNDFLVNTKKNPTKSYMTLKKGQVSFHNCHTIHCSAPNVSHSNRLALAVHLQDKNNAFTLKKDVNNKIINISYDDLCEKDEQGLPNYSDKNIFPTLFSV